MFRFKALSLVTMLAFAAFVSIVPATAQNFTVQILHNNDGESKLFPAVDGYGGAAQFLGTINSLRFDAFRNQIPSILLSSGDNFLASPELQASLDLPADQAPYDSRVLSTFVYDALCLGNHDFDFGPEFLARFINGFDPTRKAPVFLSANLDFAGEPSLQALVESGKIAASTRVFRGTEVIGVVGLTTPNLGSISSPRNVAVNTAIAQAVQNEIDKLTASGVNKIVLISHLQGIEEDLELIPTLRNVDVIIAGGGDDILANDPSQVIPGDIIEGTYPIVVRDADGNQVYVVTTGGDYRYVGNLTVTFNANGVITNVADNSGPVPVIGKVNPTVTTLLEPVATFVNGLDATIIGRTEVDLDGRRNSVRGIETNEGNLVADAFLWQARELAASFGAATPDVAIANGGGIRNNNIIAAGSDISVRTTFNILPFGNFVSVVNPISADQFKFIMENSVANITPTGPASDGTGRFAQVAGFTFEYDVNGTPAQISVDGTILDRGSRVVTITLNDGTKIVENGVVVAGARDISVVTSDFTARGGDQFLFETGFTTVGVTDQGALANYIENELNGTITAAQYPAGGEGRITQVTRTPRTTVVDIIVNSEVHNTLEAAVGAAGLVETLSGEGPFTVFAPTDAAFAALPAGTVEALLADIPALTNILLYHVLGAEVLSTQLSNGQVATTLQGSDVTVTINADGVFINNARVTIADIQADNGVVHVIDAVLLPPAATPATVVDIIVNSEVHNTLEAAVGAAGLVETLSGEGPFTVFAPTDAAFAALPAGTVEALLADIPALTNILLYHVLAGEFLSETVLSVGNLTFPVLTLQGTTVNVTVTDGKITVNNANVTVTDLIAENGVVHVIDAVLLPTALVTEPTVGALANGASKITAQIAPNPASEVLNLSYQVENTDRINVTLIGTDGKLVKNIFTGVQEAGAYNLEVAVNDLAAGIYFVSIQTGEQLQVLTVSVK